METKYIFLNRELSWLEFNMRVLLEAVRDDVPLMERLNFIARVASNFDEFFQVRVAAIKSQGNTELLTKIAERAHQISLLASKTLHSDILPEFEKRGISYISKQNFTSEQSQEALRFFHSELFPLLTPLRVDEFNFPRTENGRIYASFLLKSVEGTAIAENPFVSMPKANTQIAIVPVPDSFATAFFFSGQNNARQFTLIEDILLSGAAELFPGYSIKEELVFKVDRDADFSVDESSGENFIQAMEDVLSKRQISGAIRMVCSGSGIQLKKIISERLSLDEQAIYPVGPVLNTSSLVKTIDSECEAQDRYTEFKHFFPVELPKEGDYWSILRQKDVLLHTPYQSFEPVISFFQTAAQDPAVLAIKTTLYRPGSRKNPIMQALKAAAHNGKQVTAIVELKARFDEEHNISWAEELEKAGVIVVYGIVGYKIHAKICLVVRREDDGINRYIHLSTGNYNTTTTRQYQDFSLLTSDSNLANAATFFFNLITGYSAFYPQQNSSLYIAPLTLKKRLIDMIERERLHSEQGLPALIIAKMNSLCHKEIIAELYKASCAGVRILLNVRGICTLVPGVKGMSENITVVSVVDRYLEHSRVCYFLNGENEELYLSSADWMERNLDRRVELLFPIKDRSIFLELKDMLKRYFKDNTHSHILQSDGTWKRNFPEENSKPHRVQEEFYKKYKRQNDAQKSLPTQVFEVRRKG